MCNIVISTKTPSQITRIPFSVLKQSLYRKMTVALDIGRQAQKALKKFVSRMVEKYQCSEDDVYSAFSGEYAFCSFGRDFILLIDAAIKVYDLYLFVNIWEYLKNIDETSLDGTICTEILMRVDFAINDHSRKSMYTLFKYLRGAARGLIFDMQEHIEKRLESALKKND
jgi:hypothetical protein